MINGADGKPSGGGRLLFAALACLVLAVAVARFVRVTGDQLGAPFDVNYETPSLSTVKILRDGGNPYDPAVYAGPPFIITMYTPLYHFVVAALPEREGHPFFWGRVVSTICMLLAAAALFAVHGRLANAVVPALGVACFLLLWPVTQKASFVRCDPMALMFAAWAVAAVSMGRTARLLSAGPLLAALFCCLAMAAKQSYVAAAPACMVYLLARHRRSAWVFAATFVALLAALATVASLAWGRGFWFSVLVARSNPFEWQSALLNLQTMFRQPVFCFIVVVGGLFALRSRWHGEDGPWRGSPLLAWVLFSWAVLFLTFAKLGAFTNYFLEPALALLMWIVHVLRSRPASWFRQPARLAAVGVLAACVALEVGLASSEDYAHVDEARRQLKEGFYQDMNANLAKLGVPNPTVLNVYTSIHAYSIGNEAFLNDSLLYQMLWNSGALDPSPLIETIRQRSFDVVLIPFRARGVDPALPLGRITAAILRSYRHWGKSNSYDYYTRRP